MNTANQVSVQQRKALLEAVGQDEQVLCYVPGWRPVGLESALEWLEDSARESYNTDFRVGHEERGTVVWFKRWAMDDDEPDWPEEWPDQDDNH